MTFSSRLREALSKATEGLKNDPDQKKWVVEEVGAGELFIVRPDRWPYDSQAGSWAIAEMSNDNDWENADLIVFLRNHAEAIAEVVEAAGEAIKAGDHDGPCDNLDDPYEGCWLHVAASNARTALLRAALARLEESK